MKRKLIGLGAGAGLIFLVCLVARFVFPIESYSFLTRLKLWRSGVSEFHSQGMSGFLRDLCDPADPEARGCTCVALLHGLGDQPVTWNRLLQAPKKSWARPVKLYALNIPRNQRFVSGDSPENYRARVQADEIARSLAPLCPQWVVIGNSFGGWEAAWLALDGKLKVSKLILIDTAGTKSAVSAKQYFLNPTLESLHELSRRIYYREPKVSSDIWPHLVKVSQTSRLDEILDAQKEEDFLDGRLGTLRLPSMVLWGAGDQLIRDTVGKEVTAQIPNAAFRDIPQCGHMPQKECPVSVVQAIDDMLRVGTM